MSADNGICEKCGMAAEMKTFARGMLCCNCAGGPTWNGVQFRDEQEYRDWTKLKQLSSPSPLTQLVHKV